MSTASEVRISYIGHIGDLTAKLQSIGKLTQSEARKQVAEMNKMLSAQIAATKGAEKLAGASARATTAITKGTGQARAGYVNLGNQLQDIFVQAQMGTSPLTILAQQGGQVGSALATMGPAAIVAGSALAGLAAAAAGGYIAWRIYTEDATRATAVAQEVAAAHVALKPILDSTRDASIDLAKELGYLSDEEAKLAHNADRAFEALQASTATARKELQGITKDQQSFTGVLSASIQDMAKGGWAPYVAVVDALTTSTEEYQARADALTGTIITAQNATKENIATTANLISAQIANKDATKAASEANREYAARLREIARISKEVADTEDKQIGAITGAWTKLDDITENANIKSVDGIAKINAELRKQQDEITEVARAAFEAGAEIGSTNARTAAARVAVEADAQAQIEDIQFKAMVKATEMAQAAADAQRGLMAKQTAFVENLVTSSFGSLESIAATFSDVQQNVVARLEDELANGATTLTAHEKAELEERIANHQKMAVVGFRIAQGAAMAQAAITAALMGMQAYLDALILFGPAGLVAGPIAAGVAIAAGGASIAAIAAQAPPSFSDTPAMMQMEGGGNVRLAPGDYFAAAQSRQELQRQVAPVASSGPIVVQMVYKHKVYDRFMADNIRKGGPVGNAFRSAAGPVGHSNRSR